MTTLKITAAFINYTFHIKVHSLLNEWINQTTKLAREADDWNCFVCLRYFEAKYTEKLFECMFALCRREKTKSLEIDKCLAIGWLTSSFLFVDWVLTLTWKIQSTVHIFHSLAFLLLPLKAMRCGRNSFSPYKSNNYWIKFFDVELLPFNIFYSNRIRLLRETISIRT